MISNWQHEFPWLYQLKNPKASGIRLVVLIEKVVRKIVFLSALILIGYVMYFHFSQYHTSGDGDFLRLFPTKSNWPLLVWRAYRNLFNAIMFFDLVLLIPIVIYFFIKKNYAKLTRLLLEWFTLLLFITFSYAVAGIILDLVVFGVYFNQMILNSQ